MQSLDDGEDFVLVALVVPIGRYALNDALVLPGLLTTQRTGGRHGKKAERAAHERQCPKVSTWRLKAQDMAMRRNAQISGMG